MKKITLLAALALTVASCVSKKEYVNLEQRYNDTYSKLQKTTIEKEALEAKFSKIEERVNNYNEKINSLRGINSSLEEKNSTKLDMVGNNVAVISKKMKEKMLKTLSKVKPSALASAKNLKDSLDIAVSYNLKSTFDALNLQNSDDINIDIDKTVVMISVSDKLLFNTASYRVNKKAYPLIERLASVLNSEPSMDVMIEGHTDSRSIHNSVLEDNWDLSVKRATSIVRLLANKYYVEPSRLIASGRGSTMPLVDNNTKKNRARNRRTRIVILPNLDKFFALLSSEEDIKQ